MQDRYVYPAVFNFDPAGVGVVFPDIQGCFSQGSTQEEALAMAREALGLHLYEMEKDNEPIPIPSPVNKVELGEGEVPVLIDVWMPPLRAEMNQRAVKKTLTIPKWLNDLAEKEKVNFSHVLQEALKEHLGHDDKAKKAAATVPLEKSARREKKA